VQWDGSIVVSATVVNAAQAPGSSTGEDFQVTRLLPWGALDLSFGNGGSLTTDFAGASDYAEAVAVQTNGRIVVAGSAVQSSVVTQETSSDYALARYQPNGMLDKSFGKGGKATTDFYGASADYLAGVQRTRHPISAARAVMDKSPHVMIAGPGVDAFAAGVGLEQQPPSYFFTESRWQALVKQLTKEGKPIPPRPEGVPPAGALIPVAQLDESPDTHLYGTVGVVTLDRQGNVAAGTSTGGMQAKMPGRVGDSPIIGAGTYASNQSCAVSGTGTGEYYIRLGVAREICNLVYFKRMKLQEAADQVIHHELEALHGDGGVIAISPDGQQAWSFNTPGMFRARMSEGGKLEMGVYRDEP